jgi:hypothetical protein
LIDVYDNPDTMARGSIKFLPTNHCHEKRACRVRAAISQGRPMDFIEKIFGIAPDGGSGSLEMALILLPIVVATIIVFFRSRSQSRRR